MAGRESLSTAMARLTITQNENRPPDAPTLSVPTVILEHDAISADMAACLANSLLEHVLFLKNQVPL